MNVNGSRFHLLLGEADWGRCRVEVNSEQPRPLADWWAPASPVAAPTQGAPPLAWDGARQELHLPRQPINLETTPGEAPFTLEARRSAAADRNGNIYWIDTDRQRLRVRSAGSERESAFWPAAAKPGGGRGDFAPGPQPAAGTQGAPSPSYRALAVTEDHYLVVVQVGPAASVLLAFDLMAGGPPRETHWPTGLSGSSFAMAPRHGGGVWLLERDPTGDRPRLWELDRRLAPVAVPAATAPASTPDLFQPLAGPARTRPAHAGPAGLDLRTLTGTGPGAQPMVDPIAVVGLGCDAVLILDRDGPAGPSRLYRLSRRSGAWQAEAPARLPWLAHDCVLAGATAWAGGTVPSSRWLFVAPDSGNQVLAFGIGPDDHPFALHGAVELFPLRRYGGRALVNVKGNAWYDSGTGSPAWVPVVEQPRVRYQADGGLLTPVLDGGDLQCVWDRLLIDAGIPADTRIEVWCRAADECQDRDTDAEAPIAAWMRQPQLRLRGDGVELPWVGFPSQRRPRPRCGVGTWELLLQGQRGRFLQVRLRLAGNGTETPRLRALRAWYPRFSYPVRFLPAVYREEPEHGDFLERFLANMEGVNTELEGRIANAQALFDPRTVPADALDWLAGWFDLALDPAWDERRRRLFVAHAVDFFRWRGTVHGLRLALALAFEPCIHAGMFVGPDQATERPCGIRIVETYQTRLLGGVAAGDPGAVEAGLREGTRAGLWTSLEGSAGLAERFARTVLGRSATASEQLAPFPLGAAPDAPGLSAADRAVRQAAWPGFCLTNLGFIPAAGAGERQRWQWFLKSRYTDLAVLAEAHQRAYPGGFDGIDLPTDWPKQEKQAADWVAYCELPESTRLRWQDFLVRRWRRIERLREAHGSAWPSFGLIPLPDVCPGTSAAQTDWLQFEGQLLPMVRSAHRFSVLLPVSTVTGDAADMAQRLGLARRIVELEKPAHTIFEVRFYWSLNRLGEARLERDTLLGQGSRACELIPDTILGRAYLGAGFVGGPPRPTDGDRLLIAC